MVEIAIALLIGYVGSLLASATYDYIKRKAKRKSHCPDQEK